MLALVALCVLVLAPRIDGSALTSFKTAKIIKNSVECVGIRSMTIEVDDSVATAFAIPGSHSYSRPLIHTD